MMAEGDQRSSYSSGRLSSPPSVLSDNVDHLDHLDHMDHMEVEGAWEDDCCPGVGGVGVVVSDVQNLVAEGDIDWRERCLQLEMSLQKFRDQASKIKDLLRAKLSELEHRVIEADARAEEATQNVRLMEQKLSEAKWTPTESHERYNQLQNTVKEKDKVINHLETQVEEQKQLRIQDAKQVEAKAARIKEWVTNKLKELEEQNVHLREQNQKCNDQLELLKNRLQQLAQLGPSLRFRNVSSAEVKKLLALSNEICGNNHSSHLRQDSLRGSFEDRPDSGESLPPDLDGSSAPRPSPCILGGSSTTTPAWEVGRHRKSSSTSSVGSDVDQVVGGGAVRRQGSSSRSSDHSLSVSMDSDPPYAEVDFSKKTSARTAASTSVPPKLRLDRKKYSTTQHTESPASALSSPASDTGAGAWKSKEPRDSLETDNMATAPVSSPGSSPCPSPGYSRTNVAMTTTLSSEVRRKPVPPPRSRVPQNRAKQTVEGNHDLITSEVEPEVDMPSVETSQLGTCRLVTGSSGRCRARVADEDETHDYAEIYTPSKERITQWAASSTATNLEDQTSGHQTAGDCDIGSSTPENGKPPTPPLHRFPSWESRIYEIATSGVTLRDSFVNGACSDSTNNNRPTNNCPANSCQTYLDISVPVYAAVKGRASQIRPIPFTDDSSDSSDNDDGRVTMTTTSSHTTSGETESSLSNSSPSKSLKTASSPPPAKHGGVSPSKSIRRDGSVDSTLSDDYAIPPDAVSCDVESLDSAADRLQRVSSQDSPKKDSLEKSGYLTKLGGKLKTWRKRWFVLKNGVLTYYRTQSEVYRKPQGQIILDQVCHVTRAEGAATFEISTGKKTYYLTADSIATMEDWVRVLQNVLRRNATKLMLSKEENKPTIQGWIVKVKHGHSKRCWCVLIGKMFLYFRTPNDTTPIGQINMRDARVEEMEHVSDSDDDDREREVKDKRPEFTVGIFPNHQGPTYLLMPSKQDKATWLYHLTVVSGGSCNIGTQYEQLIQRLMEMDGDSNCVIWRHPLLLHTKENISQPLTTLPTEQLQTEAVKLFKACQLFISVLVDSAGIDYHVVLAQNALQQCLTNSELQNELYCQLIKQTSRHTQHKLGVQGWQLLALTISLFLPRNSRLLWYLQLHLQRNADPKTEMGKHAIFCQRALKRNQECGCREVKPSRMEVLSILLKNPYHHSLPHSIPVHFLNGTYQVVGFDGSSTVEEFIRNLNQEIGVRDMSQAGFGMYGDDPIDKNLEHCIRADAKLCDIISKWETALRENKLGKFENTRVVKLTYKNRLYFKSMAKSETEKEKLLLAYQVSEEIVNGRFPVTHDLAVELAALMAQVEYGDYNSERVRGSGITHANPQHQVLQVIERFFPKRYREGSPEELKRLSEVMTQKWSALKGRSLTDCIRIYLTCSRKWQFFGAKLFQAKLKTGDQSTVWLAVCDDSISMLDFTSMLPLAKFSYETVVTFGGCRDDFMLVVNRPDANAEKRSHHTERHIFAMCKPMILELTLLTADYMNALGKMHAQATASCSGGLLSSSAAAATVVSTSSSPSSSSPQPVSALTSLSRAQSCRAGIAASASISGTPRKTNPSSATLHSTPNDSDSKKRPIFFADVK